MKIKPVFTVETTKKPLVLAKGGGYRPETYIFAIVAPNGHVEQVCRHEIRE